jgi:DNA topoisomerase-1
LAATKLLIVESPSKAKTIKKYLGSTYIVKASVGHIRDLPKTRLGINIDDDFKPSYQNLKDKKDVINDLKDAAKKVKTIYIATDPDREGEAIAFHLEEILKKINPNIERVLFNEITKTSVKAAIKNAGKLDMNLVNSQQTRRFLDRIVGYKLSPLLWKKIMKGLSAGRVQSVATMIIVDREKEIEAFNPVEYWNIKALFEKEKMEFIASLDSISGEKLDTKKFNINNEAEAAQVLKDIKNTPFEVTKIEKKERTQQPPAPYITSKLQQDAASILNFSAKKTMSVAQKLYEGKDVGDYGVTGLITYMRTDSVRISQEAIDTLRDFVEQKYGKNSLVAKTRYYKTKKSAQDAHEAIRPTNVEITPDYAKEYLTNEEYKLYKIIWNRFVATQMTEAKFDKTVIDLTVDKYLFKANGEILKDKGFLILYPKRKLEAVLLPTLAETEKLSPKEITKEQKFTQPPARYTEASLIKKLEDEGIGRPSTYATIVTTIVNREYVEKIDKKFHPTETGVVVTEQLVKFFPDILNIAFTATLEDRLDLIEENKEDSLVVLKEFYTSFDTDLINATENMPSLKPQDEETDLVCDKCESMMVIKTTKRGQFLGCSNYPACKNIKDFKKDENGKVVIVEKVFTYHDEPCKNCGKRMVFKTGRYGDYYACEDYPTCKTTAPVTLNISCPECKTGKIAEKKGKKGKAFFSCSNYPECKFISWYKPINRECPDCKANYLVEKFDFKTKTSYIACENKDCKYTEK